MDVLQFSLFFAALIVAYVLVHLRLLRFEEYLREIAGLRTLNDRTKGIAESLGKLSLDRIEGQIQRLHEDLEDLREATGNVEDAVFRIPRSPESSPTSAVPMPLDVTPGHRILALVEARLLQLGYGNLRVLSDLRNAAADELLEVQVECDRNEMPCKGRVLVQNGTVRDVHIQSVANMFP